MGVAPTGAIFKGLTFDGESSKAYGIYITGSAVFNAPARDVEMVTIPGRNGTFALDRGRFENIEVTYPAGLYGDTEADFAQGISDFRNFLASRQGYVELSDDYNPGEYRLAVYKNGLDVTPEQLKAGEFEIVFECKPQRFLTSGETAITVTSGDTITNPTLFEAHPMLEVWGYGGFNIDGQGMQVISTPIGLVKVSQIVSTTGTTTVSVNIQDEFANNGDTIKSETDNKAQVDISGIIDYPGTISSLTSSESGDWNAGTYVSGAGYGARLSITNPSFLYGTAYTYQGKGTFALDGSSGPRTLTVEASLAYDGADSLVASWTYGLDSDVDVGLKRAYVTNTMKAWYLDSTKSALGSPLYFDLDIGEAYKIENDVPVSVNNAVTIPAVLPTLKPGSNTITFDNTITQFKVVPRWWKV